MKIETFKMEGPLLVTLNCFKDERGFFLESFSPKIEETLKTAFVQDNHSFSKKGVLRGMHSQKSQKKLVRAILGDVFDVFVDLRKDSKTYLSWEGVTLSGDKPQLLFVPDGFAHGFMVLTDSATVLYKVSTIYNPKLEEGFRFDDPSIGIKWPLPNPILSERDKNHPPLKIK